MTSIPNPPSAPGSRTERWRRHALAFVVGSALVLLAGLYVAFLAIPNEYEAEAVLTVSRAEAGRDYAAEATHPAVLEAAAVRLGLADAKRDAEREAAGLELRDRLTVASPKPSPSGETEIRVSTSGRTPKALADLVNTVAGIYASQCETRNRAAEAKVQSLAGDSERLTKGLAEATTMATAAAAARRDFELAHSEARSDGGGDPEAALRALVGEQEKAAADYEKTQGEIAGLTDGEKILRARLKEVPETVVTQEVTTVRNPEVVRLEKEIQQMQRQLEDLLKMYTFKHPEVIALQTDLLQKKRQLGALETRVDDSVKNSRAPNPEYALVKGKLDDTVVKLQVAKTALAPIASRRDAAAARVERLRAFVGPDRKLIERAAETAKLQQDNEALLKKTAEDLQAARAGLAPVPTLTRAAQSPVRPVRPNRTLFALFAVVAAALAGAFSVSAAAGLSPGFAGPAETERFAGAPVIGRVGAAQDTEAVGLVRTRRRLYAAATLGIAALTLLAAGVMAHVAGR